jgi:predicted RNase H-like nuclease (RuvC/YqgF family)
VIKEIVTVKESH